MCVALDLIDGHVALHTVEDHPNQGTALRLYLHNYCVRYVGTELSAPTYRTK
jgi:hypothetical protein